MDYEKIIKIFCNYDLFISHPIETDHVAEAFLMSNIEAMASGLPIVSFDTKGVNELIINKKNGFLIKENNFIAFTNEIINFDKNKNYLLFLRIKVIKHNQNCCRNLRSLL